MNVSPNPHQVIHSIHPITTNLGDPKLTIQTREQSAQKFLDAQAFIEPKKISQALEDESWVDAIQDELLPDINVCRPVLV
ncbi:hypothetical protein Tco_1018329 [Tanacetum coccineum]|uniref:Gag-Pol polyprotein n=1 Tax=Tanacetum coccineum TaxID=301880 RepID=A0ABQ5FUF4_9ASTR